MCCWACLDKIGFANLPPDSSYSKIGCLLQQSTLSRHCGLARYVGPPQSIVMAAIISILALIWMDSGFSPEWRLLATYCLLHCTMPTSAIGVFVNTAFPVQLLWSAENLHITVRKIIWYLSSKSKNRIQFLSCSYAKSATADLSDTCDIVIVNSWVE